MKELIKLLSDQTVIVTDKETIDKLFDTLPQVEEASHGSFDITKGNPAMPNSRGVCVDGKCVYFIDMDEVDFKLI